jgi:hypothetical protein
MTLPPVSNLGDDLLQEVLRHLRVSEVKVRAAELAAVRAAVRGVKVQQPLL